MEPLEKVAVLDNEVQARLLASVLGSRGIPHIMVSYRDSAYDGLFQGQRGWGHVETTERFWDEVICLLEDIRHQSTFFLPPMEQSFAAGNRAGL